MRKQDTGVDLGFTAMSDPRTLAEQVAKDFDNEVHRLMHQAMLGGADEAMAIRSTGEQTYAYFIDRMVDALRTYGDQRYEEGVKDSRAGK